MVRFVKLPQAGYPDVLDEPDTLDTWYKHASCSTVEFVPLGRAGMGIPASVTLLLACDENGKLGAVPKPPNPWVIMLGRGDVVGDACLVARGPTGELVDLPDAWAAGLVHGFREQFEPRTFVTSWEEARPDA